MSSSQWSNSFNSLSFPVFSRPRLASLSVQLRASSAIGVHRARVHICTLGWREDTLRCVRLRFLGRTLWLNGQTGGHRGNVTSLGGIRSSKRKESLRANTDIRTNCIKLCNNCTMDYCWWMTASVWLLLQLARVSFWREFKGVCFSRTVIYFIVTFFPKCIWKYWAMLWNDAL